MEPLPPPPRVTAIISPMVSAAMILIIRTSGDNPGGGIGPGTLCPGYTPGNIYKRPCTSLLFSSFSWEKRFLKLCLFKG